MDRLIECTTKLNTANNPTQLLSSKTEFKLNLSIINDRSLSTNFDLISQHIIDSESNIFATTETKLNPLFEVAPETIGNLGFNVCGKDRS